MVVTATRLPTSPDALTAAVTVLDGAQLRAEGLTHVGDALRRVPGLALARTSSFGSQQALFVRGGQSNYTRVLVDGVPVRSCIVPAVACDGSEVRSIEGLDDDAVTNELREAFRREHGLQCGFCTPGMLIASRDIVLRLPDADERRIRHELSGNLCRCTGYVGIVNAVHNVVEKSGAWFSYKGERLGQGRENVKNLLKENKEIANNIEHDVKVALGFVKAEAAPA